MFGIKMNIDDIKKILFDKQLNLQEILVKAEKYSVEYITSLETGYNNMVYGFSHRKNSFPFYFQHVELCSATDKSILGDFLTIRNNRASLDILFSKNRVVTIISNKNNLNIFLNSEKNANADICNKNKISINFENLSERIDINYPRWWQFKRYGEIIFKNSMECIDFDTGIPALSIFQNRKFPEEIQKQLPVIIAVVLWRTTRSLSM